MQCSLTLNGLSVFPLEILFEEFYKKAIKSFWNQMKMQSLILFVYLFLNMHLEGHLKIILNAADR